jgi:hypothetical protein
MLAMHDTAARRAKHFWPVEDESSQHTWHKAILCARFVSVLNIWDRYE